MINASYKISYLHKLFINLTAILLVDLDPILLYSDNMGAITIATNLDGNKTAWTRHIDIYYHITREVLVNGILQLKYI